MRPFFRQNTRVAVESRWSITTTPLITYLPHAYFNFQVWAIPINKIHYFWLPYDGRPRSCSAYTVFTTRLEGTQEDQSLLLLCSSLLWVADLPTHPAHGLKRHSRVKWPYLGTCQRMCQQYNTKKDTHTQRVAGGVALLLARRTAECRRGSSTSNERCNSAWG